MIAASYSRCRAETPVVAWCLPQGASRADSIPRGLLTAHIVRLPHPSRNYSQEAADHGLHRD